MWLVKNARLSLPFTEVMRIARLTSSLTDVLHLSSPRPRLRHDKRLALLFHPNLTLNLYIFFFALSRALLTCLLLLLASETVLPGSRFRSMSLTWDPTFPFLSQRPCVAEPEATFPSSAKPRALRSLTCLSANPFHPLNFLRLPPTYPHLLPQVQTKLPIPC